MKVVLILIKGVYEVVGAKRLSRFYVVVKFVSGVVLFVVFSL